MTGIRNKMDNDMLYRLYMQSVKYKTTNIVVLFCKHGGSEKGCLLLLVLLMAYFLAFQ